MDCGDVIIVEFPEPYGSRGHEQIGTRPAIIVQSDTDSSRLPTTMIIPFTSRQQAELMSNVVFEEIRQRSEVPQYH
jgi:mRNA-degrading endonuclease toxin of MazEF toxin-antitoxin module